MSRKPRPKKLTKTTELYKGNNEEKSNFPFIRPKLEPRTESQAECIKLIRENDIIFIGGPAGTGKSFLSVIIGLLDVLKGKYDKLVLVRPAVTTEEIGLLPGTIEDKVSPFLEPMLELILKFVTKEEFEKLKKEGRIQVRSMAYLRGLTLDKSFIVADEMQNATEKQMRLLITRIGEKSKLVIQGDENQSDLKSHDKGSLDRHINLFKDFAPFASFRFTENDIVRNPLITIYLNRIKDETSVNTPGTK